MTTTHRVRAAIALTVLAGVLVSGCGNDDPQADPSTATPSTSGSTAPSDSATESGSPSDGVATGDQIESSSFTVSMPEGFPAKTLGKDFTYTADEKDGNSFISINMTDTYNNPKLVTLDQVAALTLRAGSWQTKPARVDDTELGGEPAYHFAGLTGGSNLDVYGGVVDGISVSISFNLNGMSDSERHTLIDSVLASWQWK